MTLATDLLKQAQHLSTLEPKHPKQASLRRSVSAAYYSLFHLLIASGSQVITQKVALRPHVARTYQHGDLKKAANSILLIQVAYQSGRQPSQQLQWLGQFLRLPIEPELSFVCQTFIDLQELRHQADYDLSQSFSRLQAATAVSQARAAHVSWKAIRHSHNAEIFLLAAAKVLVSR
ncbi:MAG: hypothetical protein ACO331_05125 [Prochlorothrix sp.]